MNLNWNNISNLDAVLAFKTWMGEEVLSGDWSIFGWIWEWLYKEQCIFLCPPNSYFEEWMVKSYRNEEYFSTVEEAIEYAFSKVGIHES